MAANNKYRNKIDQYVEETGEDQSEEKVGGTFTPTPEGKGTARLVGYVELGDHFVKYKGEDKDYPEARVRLTFELSGKNFPPRETEDGDRPWLHNETLSISASTRSKFFKLFNILNDAHGNQYKHMAQMAADNVEMNFEVRHNVVGEGKEKRTFVNVWHGGNWLIGAPEREDEDGEIIRKAVPEAISDTRIFLFNRPDIDDWNALYIEGQRDDGSSKNWLQELILNSQNYPGSALESLLNDLPDVPVGNDDDSPKEQKKTSAPAQTRRPAPKGGKADKLGTI